MNFFSFTAVQEQFRYHSLFLRFRNPELERKFRTHHNDTSINKTRTAIVLGIFLYAGFLLLDRSVVPEGFINQLLIRLGIVTPLLIMMLAASFLKSFQNGVQTIAAGCILVTGIGHLAMPLFSVLPAGYLMSTTNLVIIFLFVFSGSRFIPSLCIASLLLPGYILTELLIMRSGSTLFFNNLIFVLSTAIIGTLAGYIIERSQRVEFAQRETIREHHNRIQGELYLARKIQYQLIPPVSPSRDLSFCYHPMELVGGDFFDFVDFDNPEKTGIFISDVSGHGVPAAFITSMLKSVLLQSGNRSEDPATLLDYINDVIGRQTDGNFVTALYGIFDRTNRSFTYANAGHNDPLVIETDINYLSGNKSCPIAIPKELIRPDRLRSLENNSVEIPQGSKLLLYTDGFTEATPAGGDTDFETSGMREALLRHRKQPCHEFVSSVFNSLVAFNGKNKFEDDICMVCLDV